MRGDIEVSGEVINNKTSSAQRLILCCELYITGKIFLNPKEKLRAAIIGIQALLRHFNTFVKRIFVLFSKQSCNH